MKYLVTGGSGFIGSALVLKLLADGHDVLNVDALTYAANPLSLKDAENTSGYEFRHLDICETAALTAAVKDYQPDVIFHLAAESHVDRSIDDPEPFLKTNVQGTGAVLTAAFQYRRSIGGIKREAFKMVHVSTDEVYGSLEPDAPAFTEDHPYDPSSPYSASKAASDHLVRAWHKTYGLPVMITNCSNNYGPRQFPEKLIPLFLLNGLDGKSLPIYGDGMQVRDWLHVDDHVAALLAVSERGQPGRTYNVGARCEKTNMSMAHAIRKLTGEKSHIGRIKDRPGHDRRYAIDPSRLEGELGWTPRIDFESGLKQTLDWYKTHPEWVAAARRSYDGKRLGRG